MQALATVTPDVLLLRPKVISDSRWFPFECYNHNALAFLGIRHAFVQDNLSRSCKNVTFGKWVTATRSAENKHMLWMPPGFAHGFLVSSDWAAFVYKAADYYASESERTIPWDDTDLGIEWPLSGKPRLSTKDHQEVSFHETEACSKAFMAAPQ